MYRNIVWIGLFILLIPLTFIQCIFDDIEPEPDVIDFSTAIDSLFVNAGKLSDPPGYSLVSTGEQNGVEVEANGATYFCDEKEFQLTQRLESFTATAFDIANPNIAALYPGSIVRLGELGDENILTSIGNVTRPEITLQSSALNGATKTVLPEGALQAVADMEAEFNGEVPANFVYDAVEAYSSEQALLDLGIKVNWLAGSVANKLSVSESVEERTVMVSFAQSYHTVSMEYPGTPSAFFAEGVTADQLASRMSSDNPLGYISQVTYGRMLIAKITYSTSNSLTRNELAAGLRQGLVGVNFSFDTELEQVLESSTVELSVLGGSTDILSQLSAGNNALEILQNIQNYLEVDAQNLDAGLPIGYTVRYLLDNSLFATGGITEYTAQTCTIDPEEVSIRRVRVEQFPPSDNSGYSWDSFTNGFDPDIYWVLYEYIESSESFNILTSLDTDLRKENATSANVPFSWGLSVPYKLPDWETKVFVLGLWDYDSFSDDDYLGGVVLYMPDLLPTSGQFPNEVTLANEDAGIRITLELLWE
ncbi:MAG TPA: hypothetical protein DCE41_25285 [Cytophagales bacterium]|nr:hypothetical protein [Cytophagales bacterium]HAP61015.1 hypothetical protein [Cytophagales bacterium]